MRKIQIQVPPSITIRGIEVSYQFFVRHLCDTDNRFTLSGAGIRAAMRIEQTIGTNELHVIEEADWALLQQAAENPSGGYPELVERSKDGLFVQKHRAARACLGFVDAISSGVPVVENGTKKDAGASTDPVQRSTDI